MLKKHVSSILVLLSVLAYIGWEYYKMGHVPEVNAFCVSGVSYLRFSSGVTPEYLPDGKIQTCGGETYDVYTPLPKQQ